MRRLRGPARYLSSGSQLIRQAADNSILLDRRTWYPNRSSTTRNISRVPLEISAPLRDPSPSPRASLSATIFQLADLTHVPSGAWLRPSASVRTRSRMRLGGASKTRSRSPSRYALVSTAVQPLAISSKNEGGAAHAPTRPTDELVGRCGNDQIKMCLDLRGPVPDCTRPAIARAPDARVL